MATRPNTFHITIVSSNGVGVVISKRIIPGTLRGQSFSRTRLALPSSVSSPQIGYPALSPRAHPVSVKQQEATLLIIGYCNSPLRILRPLLPCVCASPLLSTLLPGVMKLLKPIIVTPQEVLEYFSDIEATLRPASYFADSLRNTINTQRNPDFMTSVRKSSVHSSMPFCCLS